MNINPEFISPERPNAVEAMDLAMNYLYENFINSKIDEENADMVLSIGTIFKDIAEKAEAYYQLQEKGYEKNPNSLN
jgi:methanogenic corrinoid protein MtbC1